MFPVLIIYLTLLTWSICGKPFDSSTCGYEACPAYDPNAFNVHLIPHSHDDVGWLKTVDQYYFGEVSYILNSVTQSLKKNPERRFVQAETAFFKKWFEDQTDTVKQDVINLVNNGQLEFINGAWSMNDEAIVHYQSVIDQFTLGLRYLDDKFGACGRPTVGWQVDAFGHSREQASIAAQMGFDSLFFSRVDFREQQERIDTQNLEMIWRGSTNLGNTSDIFTSILYTFYTPPSGFCFDVTCNDAVIINDERSIDNNIKDRVEEFADYVKTTANYFRTNNLLVPMGGDFHYRLSELVYSNLDKLILGFQLFPQNTYDNKRINVFYSTPSCYAKFVHEYVNSHNLAFSMKTADFFPFSDARNVYWTGFYTSRPASKGLERKGNNLLQVAKQLAVIAHLPYENEKLNNLKEIMGVMQHHDAITGTEKQAVANNYHVLLFNAISDATDLTSSILSNLISGNQNVEDFGFKSCMLANISHCPQTQGDQFTVAIYNPLGRISSTPVSLPVEYDSWNIVDPKGQQVVYQISSPIIDYRFTGLYISPYNLEFVAKDLPPLSYSVYQFRRGSSKKKKITKKQPRAVDDLLTIGYNDINFQVDGATGLLSTITMNDLKLEVSQQFMYYMSQAGSGAYIFFPTEGPYLMTDNPVPITPVYGDVYQGVIQDFGSFGKQTIKVYKEDPNYIEFDWTIGPLTPANFESVEVISRYSTYLKTGYSFYTDANGREMMKRTINARPDYTFNDTSVPSNYYPVSSRLLLKDDGNDVELAVLTDRSEGGASITDGQIEFLLHRACVRDDGRGVAEALNEQEYGRGQIIRGKHYLVLGRSEGRDEKSLAAIQRDLTQKKLLTPWTFITDKNVNNNLKNLQQSFMKAPLKDNIYLLTLEPWKDDTLLLRLEHFLEKEEDKNLSQDTTVDVANLLSTISITELRETTLGGNQLLEENERLGWPGSQMDKSKASPINKEDRITRDIDDLNIELAPMQIRTFLAKVDNRLKT